MEYFKINGVDFSKCVNALEVRTVHNAKTRTNAAGNMNVKYINTKKVITVGIIPLESTDTKNLITELNKFQVEIEYLEPETNTVKTINCIIPNNDIKYHRIWADRILMDTYKITFTEK